MALLLGLAGGVILDQAFPEYVPSLTPGHGRSRVDTAEMEQALRVLQAHYYDRLDYAKLAHGTVRGMIQSLNDPPSQYLDPNQYRSQQQSYAGRFTGIGIYVSFRADYPLVTGIIPASPAAAAGMRAGDEILRINGRDARGLRSEDGGALIQGPEGSSVTLSLRRGGADLPDVTLRRTTILVPSVKSAMLENGVLYLRILSFGAQTAADFEIQLKRNLPAARGLVLDLRDDGGGYIDAAQGVISDLVSEGEAFELRDRRGTVERRPVTGDHPAGARPPAVVLVDANTASSSEIVAGSLRQHGRARMVGAPTYGKASVQQDFPLPNGADLHLTIRHWYLADGSSVEGGGWAPDVLVPTPDRAAMFDVDNPPAGHSGDTQLNRALELLATPSGL